MLRHPTARVAQVAHRLFTLGRPAIPLKIVAEADVLTVVDDVFSPGAERCAGTGVTTHLVYSRSFTNEHLGDWLAGRAGGSPLPDWASGKDGALRGGVQLSRVSNAWYAPRFGAVVGAKGEVFKSTIAEALFFTPTLAALPHVKITPQATTFYPPRIRTQVPRATVFAAWGGLHNYGHFLLDSLPALWSSATIGALRAYPPIAPPLNAWQMDLVNLLLGRSSTLITVPQDVVEIDDVLFSSPMDHFLHTPNHPLNLIREEILRNTPRPDLETPRRIYLTRETDPKRKMVNETELQQALETRGFTVINPGTLSIEQQILLFSQAYVIVSATGAGLANALFAGENTKIFELFPSNFPGIWVRNLCFMLGLNWYGFVSPSPIEEHLIVIEGEARPGVEFCWQIMLQEFLSFMDDRI